jgi:hypothetical protein
MIAIVPVRQAAKSAIMDSRIAALIERLQSGSEIDWRATREEIHDLHGRSTSEPERALLVGVYTNLTDFVERSEAIKDGKFQKLRETRRKDYLLFLIRESTDGELINPDKLDHITPRGCGWTHVAG